MPEEQQKTGEEDEQVLFASEGTLFQFDDQDSKTWRERGRGELRVNKAHSGAQTQHPPCLLMDFNLSHRVQISIKLCMLLFGTYLWQFHVS